MNIQLSKDQQTVVDAWIAGENIALDASAGTGKTTTIMAAMLAMSLHHFSIYSVYPRQLYVVFMKSAQLEAEQKVKQWNIPNVTVKTMNGAGHGALMHAWIKREKDERERRGLDDDYRFRRAQVYADKYGKLFMDRDLANKLVKARVNDVIKRSTMNYHIQNYVSAERGGNVTVKEAKKLYGTSFYPRINEFELEFNYPLTSRQKNLLVKQKQRVRKGYEYALTQQVGNLCSLIQGFLIDYDDTEAIVALMEKYRIYFPAEVELLDIIEELSLVLKIGYEKALDVYEKHINFDDQIRIPYSSDEVSIISFPYVMVDEAQDLNPSKYELAWLLGERRWFFAGDEHQSVMAFAGALDDAFPQIIKRFNLKKYTLRESHRFGPVIANAAQRYVEDIKGVSKVKGKVKEVNYLPIEYPEGSAIIGRWNKALIYTAFKLAKAGVNIRLHNSKQLYQADKVWKEFTDEHEDVDRESFWDYWSEYTESKRVELEGSPDSVIDQWTVGADAIEVAFEYTKEDQTPVNEMVDRLKKLLVDKKDGVLLITAHSAKGAEYKHVYILLPDTFNNDQSKQKMPEPVAKQEPWVHYVAITRAMEDITLINDIIGVGKEHVDVWKEWEEAGREMDGKHTFYDDPGPDDDDYVAQAAEEMGFDGDDQMEAFDNVGALGKLMRRAKELQRALKDD